MRTALAIAGTALALGASGCVRTLEVEVPAAPSVEIDTSHLAVVTVDRACAEVADSLVAALNRSDVITVDPSSPVRLELFSCGRSLHPVIDVELDGRTDRRRVTVEGRSHAVVAVKTGDQVQAHLIGSGRHTAQGAWGDTALWALGRTVTRELDNDLASDLAVQISPMPRLVQRRIYRNAGEGTARELHNLAVHAEHRGDLREARRLASLAHHQDPSSLTAAYVQELERLIYITQAPGQPARP